MKNLTGNTRLQNEALYISAVNTLIALGFNESQAREVVKETFKESLVRASQILLNPNARLIAEIQINLFDVK